MPFGVLKQTERILCHLSVYICPCILKIHGQIDIIFFPNMLYFPPSHLATNTKKCRYKNDRLAHAMPKAEHFKEIGLSSYLHSRQQVAVGLVS